MRSGAWRKAAKEGGAINNRKARKGGNEERGGAVPAFPSVPFWGPAVRAESPSPRIFF